MKLRQLAALYAKTRVISWLTTTNQAVCIFTTDGCRINLAEFCNGQYRESPPLIPDFMPPEWQQGQQKPPGESP